MPTMIRASVVLPQPLGPRTDRNSPSATEKETSARTERPSGPSFEGTKNTLSRARISSALAAAGAGPAGGTLAPVRLAGGAEPAAADGRPTGSGAGCSGPGMVGISCQDRGGQPDPFEEVLLGH